MKNKNWYWTYKCSLCNCEAYVLDWGFQWPFK